MRGGICFTNTETKRCENKTNKEIHPEGDERNKRIKNRTNAMGILDVILERILYNNLLDVFVVSVFVAIIIMNITTIIIIIIIILSKSS